MNRAEVEVRRLTPRDVAAVRTWRYPGRDGVYDPGDAVDPEHDYHAVVDAATQELVGYCCFGPEASVPGLEPEPGTLDVGVGLRPDLVGSGRGAGLTRGVLGYGAERYRPERFRVAVLAWNERSLRTVRRAGFEEVDRFDLPDDRTFVVLTRAVTRTGGRGAV